LGTGITIGVSGLDTETLINELMKVERQPLQQLEARRTSLDVRKQAWDAIKTKLDSLASSLTSLLSVGGFGQKTVSVSDSAVLSASAESSAPTGSYEIQVLSLARSQVVTSGSFGTSNTALGITGDLTLNGKTITLMGTETLESLAARINDTEGIGVSAAVLQVAPGEYRLTLTAEKEGTAGSMSFGDEAGWTLLGVRDADGTLNEVRSASDARFTINGITFLRDSNKVADAIPGVTLNLAAAADPVTGAGGKTVVTVGYDDQAVVSQVKAFIAEYNSLIDTVKKYDSWNADTKQGGVLFGDPLLQRLLRDIQSVLFREVDGAPDGFRFASQLGISTGAAGTYSKDGKLTLDEAKLTKALAENREAVAAFFGAKTVNVSRSSAGAQASASSTAAGTSPLCVIDGDLSAGMWQDDTPGEFPDTLEISFAGQKTIDRVLISTVNSDSMPAAQYGIKDVTVQYWDGSDWVTVGEVSGNSGGTISLTFTPVTTDKIRLVCNGSNDGQHSRITEVQVYQENTGILNALRTAVRRYSAVDGYLPMRKAQIEAEDEALARQIASKQRSLDMRLAYLQRQFSALEVLLSRLNTQGAWLSSQLAGLYSNM